TDAGQALQADQQAAHGFFQELVAGDAKAEDHPKHDRDGVADYNPLQTHDDGNQKALIGKAGPQGLGDTPGRGKQIGRPNLELGEQDPYAQERGVEDDVTSGAFHGWAPGSM